MHTTGITTVRCVIVQLFLSESPLFDSSPRQRGAHCVCARWKLFHSSPRGETLTLNLSQSCVMPGLHWPPSAPSKHRGSLPVLPLYLLPSSSSPSTLALLSRSVTIWLFSLRLHTSCLSPCCVPFKLSTLARRPSRSHLAPASSLQIRPGLTVPRHSRGSCRRKTRY